MNAKMTTEARWTLNELVRRVTTALATPAYPGPPNGRVRDVPDKRGVRWYTTIGLVDRPAAMQGRTALYGSRHLRQIVAVKRLQAEGRSLAEIQAELAGATDETLRRVAAVPDELVAAEPDPRRGSAPAMRPASRPGRGQRFWTEPPTAVGAVPVLPGAPDHDANTVTMVAAVRLPGGALVLLPRQPDRADLPTDADISEINAAAKPLLDLLANRGLLNLEEGNPT